MPQMNKMLHLEKGFYIALAALVLLGFLGVITRVGVTTVHIDPFVFSCVNLFVGGLTMFVLAGKGTAGLETLKHKRTWVYGVLRVLDVVLFSFALLYISATEAQLLVPLGAVLAMVAVYVLLGRKPSKADLPGMLMVVTGIVALMSQMEGGLLNPGVLLMLGAIACVVVLSLIAETHPVVQSDIPLRARFRFTGAILFATAAVFLLAGLFLGALGRADVLPQVVSAVFAQFPSVGAYADSQTLLWGVVVGVLVRAPMMFCILYAARLMKSENYMMTLALIPFVTMACEGVFHLLGLLDFSGFGLLDMAFALLIVLGSFTTLGLRMVQQAAAEQRNRQKSWMERVDDDI